MRVGQFTLAICKICGAEFKKRTKKKRSMRTDLRPVDAVTCSKNCARKNNLYPINPEKHREYSRNYYHEVVKKRNGIKHKEV